MLKRLRKVRKKMWLWQIILGDIIAFMNGGISGYFRRIVRKKLNKATGKRINKFRR